MPSFTAATRALRWAAVGGWMAVIFGFSSLHGSQTPGRYGTFGHFVGYVVLGALLQAALVPGAGASAAVRLSTLIASAYGVSDELHQAFVPGRTPDVLDWSVDTLGGLAGAALIAYIIRKAASRRPSHVPAETSDR